MMLSNKILTAIWFLIFSQYLDTITTLRGISIYGTAIEANGIVGQIFDIYGSVGFIGAKIMSIVIVLAMGYICIRIGYSKMVIWLFFIMGLVVLVVVVNNFTYL